MKSSIITLFLIAIFIFSKVASASVYDPDSTDKATIIPPAPFTYEAVKMQSSSISVDGSLEEEAWQQAEIISGFTQRIPDTGMASSERTEVKILYDNDAVYIGARLYNSSPETIASTLFRRDGEGYSDWFFAGIDSYNDQRTAFVFALNPRGVQKDLLIYNDNREDLSWNAVWQSASNVKDGVWSLEMRIPLSQIRYSEAKENGENSWGINFSRYIADRDEVSYWAPTPPDDSGIVSKFGRLSQLENLPKKHQLEVMPYFSSQMSRTPFTSGNPFVNEFEPSLNAGADIKYGLSSNLRLTATINPDFGQVEADPAEVNLSAFETFHSERRPFFLEGTEIFDFTTNSMLRLGDVPAIFYSRRIGRSPRGGVPHSAGFSDVPESTPITGAVKLSGKTSGGWSVGFMNALTREQQASYSTTDGNILSTPVEPLTNYSVARVQRDFNNGNTVAGILFNSVLRDNSSPVLSRIMTDQAFTAGMDGEHRWSDNTYRLVGRVAFSRVTGSPEAITMLQRNSARYYQRPDAKRLSVDNGMTSLSGFYGDLMFTRQTRHWITQFRAYRVTPGFEVNDLGFLTTADRTTSTAMQLYQQPNSSISWLRNYNAFIFSANTLNSEGKYVNNLHGAGASFRFNNFWSFNTDIFASVRSYDDRLTRGGPLALRPASLSNTAILSSDNRKKLQVRFLARQQINEQEGYSRSGSVRIKYRPHPAGSISIEPSYSQRKSVTQYTSTIGSPIKEATYGSRYLFADILQQTVSAMVRVEWTFSPKLSLQMVAQPFVSSGKFSRFKELDRPGTMNYSVYGEDAGTVLFNETTNMYEMTPKDSGDTFAVRNPDFNVRSLLGNAVVRWEYRPGSTIYFVWSQSRSSYQNNGTMDIREDFGDLFGTSASHTFLVKFSYWIGS